MEHVTVAGYLLQRLHQCGIRSIFGVPGDYNLRLLDYVKENSLHWIGNCNELNAGYAADGYSRVHGVAALITTYGVGELSAMNAIAGAYAEKAPVIHIVGSPAQDSQQRKQFLHHTLGDGQYDHFINMYKHITVAQADLKDGLYCAELIDSAIQQCLFHHRPVYIAVPEDMVDVQIDGSGLSKRIPSIETLPSEKEYELVHQILSRIYRCRWPTILVDGESNALGFTNELNELAEITGWPTFTTPFGKSIINEELPNFYGLWKRPDASDEHLAYAKKTDLILCFGPHWSSTNTYSFYTIPEKEPSVMFCDSALSIGKEVHRDISVDYILKQFLKKLDVSNIPRPESLAPLNRSMSICAEDCDSPITQARFYSTFSRLFQSRDIVLAETGTAGHGCRDFKLPTGTILLNPVTWLSIGYMLPAALGASLAKRDTRLMQANTARCPEPRTILFVGDGSFQVSAQELSTILRYRINMLVVLINNDGYTIERCIHGKNQAYNDIASWDYLSAPRLFGSSSIACRDYPVRTKSVKSWVELELFLDSEIDCQMPCFSMLEVIVDREDAPQTLLKLLNEQYV